MKEDLIDARAESRIPSAIQPFPHFEQARGSTMRIAVIGAGGFGGYFGARLAKGGADVRFLARGSHLAAMRANGLAIEGGPERICANPVIASDNPADLGVADFVLLAVKLWDTEMVLDQ